MFYGTSLGVTRGISVAPNDLRSVIGWRRSRVEDSMRNFLFIAAALGGVLLACGGAPVEDADSTDAPIVGGQTENGHPAVAFLSYDLVGSDGANKGSFNCTATLVTKNVLLTAAHCVKPAGAGDRYVNHTAYFGTSPGTAKPNEIFRGVKVAWHPKYDPNKLGDFDVAAIELDRQPPIEPVKVARSYGDLQGQNVTHVGWGFSVANGAANKSGLGTKRSVTLPVTQQTADTLRTGNGKSSICNGDSGGPALFRDARGQYVVVAVHSWIDDNNYCLKNGYSARSDRYVDFLAPFMASAFVDLQAVGDRPAPPDKGVFDGECCINGQCYTCGTKQALDRCVGLDLNACFAECGQNPVCLIGCADRLGAATRDPSACLPLAPQGQPGPQQPQPEVKPNGGGSCSSSVQCSNGQCYCGGAKAGARCDGQPGRQSSCDVVCRVCN